LQERFKSGGAGKRIGSGRRTEGRGRGRDAWEILNLPWPSLFVGCVGVRDLAVLSCGVAREHQATDRRNAGATEIANRKRGTMKNTCVVSIRYERYNGRIARFHPHDDGSVAEVTCWPVKLKRKFGPRPKGIYAIRRVTKSTRAAVSIVITGQGGGQHPAYFERPFYGLCRRFMRELGVAAPRNLKTKTIHLLVRKSPAKSKRR
jgi:hypothetical protein